SCGAGAMMYILPMLLGRTYDFRQDTIGIDIFDKKDVEDAMEIWKLSPDARPLQFWELLDPKSVGTHVVTQITWGGQIYASVNFISLKSEYTEEIKAEVKASIAKSGAFDVDAQGKSEVLNATWSFVSRYQIWLIIFEVFAKICIYYVVNN
ncbi:hypothetical protein AVEN_162281-1, partial [Araneus ventricosus]